MIQDILICLSGLIFVVSLLPQIYHNFKNKRCDITYSTSFLSVFGLGMICIAYVTMPTSEPLALSSLTTFGTLCMWVTIGIQRYVYY